MRILDQYVLFSVPRSGWGALLVAGILAISVIGTPRPAAASHATSVAQVLEIEPVQAVAVTSAWVTAGDAIPRVLLHQRSAVHYHAAILNQTETPQLIQVTWQTSGPCGELLNATSALITPPGEVDWVYMDVLAPDVCAGDYELVVTANYEGATSQASANFTIFDLEIFLPLTRR